MGLEAVFLVVAGILFIGFIGEKIFDKTKIPDVIWLILIGIILGSVLKWTNPEAFTSIAPFFTTFALIFLLFEAGINIDIRSFLKSAPQGLRLTVLSFILSFGIVFLIGLAIGKGLVLSLLMGAILAGLSSAVVLPIIRNIKVDMGTRLSLIFDSAISDVLCILGTITIIEIFTTTESVSGWNILSQVLASFLIAILIGIVIGFIWNKLIVSRLSSHLYVLTLAIMLMVYAVTQMLNANGAIAGLVFGLILGNTKKIAKIFKQEGQGHKIASKSGKEFYGEIAFFIKTFFFVYLGVLINFSEMFSFLWALLIVIGIYLIRPFAVYLSFGKETPLNDIKILETLLPKGLAAAVLVQLPLQAGIPGAETLVNIVLAVILISIIASTIFVFLIQRNKYPGVMKFLYKKYEVKVKKKKTKPNPVEKKSSDK